MKKLFFILDSSVYRLKFLVSLPVSGGVSLCVVVRHTVLWCVMMCVLVCRSVKVCCSVRSVIWCVVVCRSVPWRVAVCCGVLWCIVVCLSVPW